MKKVSILLLLLLYLIPAVGFSVSAHYCGGKLASVSFHLFTTDGCCCGGKKMNSKCCKTKTASIKLNEVHKNSPQLACSCFKETDKPQFFSVINTFDFNLIPPEVFHSIPHPPLSNSAQPVYLLNRVFRI